MMYSNRSEHNHRGQYCERGLRQRDGYDDRWEERREPHRDIPQDSYYKYGGDGHRGAERTSRSREYSDSPKRLYSTDSMNRDWSRKSPVRRPTSSSDWASSEKKRRRFTDDDDDDDDGYRYRREAEDKLNRLSPDGFSHSHTHKRSKHFQLRDEDFKYKKTTPESRQKYQNKEYTYGHHRDDLNSRPSSEYSKDQESHERSWDRSQSRRHSQDYTTKSYSKPRERTRSPSTDYDDHRQNRTRFSLNGSSGQSFESDVSHQFPAAPEEKKTKGFQRFLDVLNKGVNVDMLTKIVTQNSEGGDDRPRSPVSFLRRAERPWSPSYDGVQQAHDKNSSHKNERVRAQRVASSPHRSFSPKRISLSDERFLQKGNGERSFLGSSSRSRSPSVVEKITLTPEEEHKRRQMQDVLQAIGMNLGFEELGQMSNRIQERLYGKRDGDREGQRRRSRERDTRRAYSPRLQSRSSSSRSSYSPPTQDYRKRDSDSAPRDLSEERRGPVLKPVEYDSNSRSNTLYDVKKYETDAREKTAVSQTFSQNHTYTSSESPLPVISSYSPVNSSPVTPFPAPPPAARSTLPPALPPALPPYFPNVGPRFLFPPQHPLFSAPHAPPLNLFPGLLPQTRHLFPPHISNPRPPFFNLPHMNAIQPMSNTQNKKTLSRPRCLQVIETKQVGDRSVNGMETGL